MIRIKRNSPLYNAILLGLLGVGLALLWAAGQRYLVDPVFYPSDDYYNYWKAGQLNTATDYFLLTPPWALPIFTLFGLLPYPISRLLWLLGSIALVLGSTNLLWRLYDGKTSLRWLGWVLAFSFGPTISILEKGQIGPLILISLSAFCLLAADEKNDYASGAVLLLASIKPQLVYLFWPALLFWVVAQKRWKVLLGFAAAFAVSSALALLLRPGVVEEYLAALPQAANWATPTLGTYLRLLFGLQYFWLQYLPSLAGLAWMGWYWLRHREGWSWSERAPALLFASILTSAYAWTYDQILLLPAVLALVCSLTRRSKPALLWALVGLLTGINLLDLFLHRPLADFWFVWLAPAYWLWYYGGRWLEARWPSASK